MTDENEKTIGRPTKFRPEYISIIKKMCELGAINVEIAEALGVSYSTLGRWLVERPELAQAMKLGKAASDNRVVNSLYMAATGYERDEIEIKVVNGDVVEVPVRKWYPPNPTSCIYWTRNRLRNDWSQNPEEESSDDMSTVLSKLIDKLPS